MPRWMLLCAVSLLALTGCAPEPAPSPTPTATAPASAAATPSSTPTPTPAGPTPVDPAGYATELAAMFGDGVDFDSPDGNVHCGIWAAFPWFVDGTVTSQAYAGCRPAQATYKTEPSKTPDGEIGCRGGQLTDGLEVGPVCNSGQAFAGEAPMDGPVGVLPVNSSITFAGITCVAIDAETIECVRESDGQGFSIGRTSYRYF